jgi:hypothetical protein
MRLDLSFEPSFEQLVALARLDKAMQSVGYKKAEYYVSDKRYGLRVWVTKDRRFNRCPAHWKAASESVNMQCGNTWSSQFYLKEV